VRPRENSNYPARTFPFARTPAEQHWDRTTFLEQTCRKAGLRLDAWKNGATIEAFTTGVFGDKAESRTDQIS
jgi:AMMECR1 domain-containing protein